VSCAIDAVADSTRIASVNSSLFIVLEVCREFYGLPAHRISDDKEHIALSALFASRISRPASQVMLVDELLLISTKPLAGVDLNVRVGVVN
jgi:hypothetical protein